MILFNMEGSIIIDNSKLGELKNKMIDLILEYQIQDNAHSFYILPIDLSREACSKFKAGRIFKNSKGVYWLVTAIDGLNIYGSYGYPETDPIYGLNVKIDDKVIHFENRYSHIEAYQDLDNSLLSFETYEFVKEIDIDILMKYITKRFYELKDIY